MGRKQYLRNFVSIIPEGDLPALYPELPSLVESSHGPVSLDHPCHGPRNKLAATAQRTHLLRDGELEEQRSKEDFTTSSEGIQPSTPTMLTAAQLSVMPRYRGWRRDQLNETSVVHTVALTKVYVGHDIKKFCRQLGRYGCSSYHAVANAGEIIFGCGGVLSDELSVTTRQYKETVYLHTLQSKTAIGGTILVGDISLTMPDKRTDIIVTASE